MASAYNITKKPLVRTCDIISNASTVNTIDKQCFYMYRIAQNSGGGKLWQIWRIECHSPIFYPAKITLKFLRFGSRLCEYYNGTAEVLQTG